MPGGRPWPSASGSWSWRRSSHRPIIPTVASTGSHRAMFGAGEGEAASIAAMVSHAVRANDLDADRVFVTGLSAGGAMAAAMLAVYPEVFAGGAVIAGIPYGVAGKRAASLGRDEPGRWPTASGHGRVWRLRARMARRFPRLSIWHGDSDGGRAAWQRRRSGPAMERAARRFVPRRIGSKPCRSARARSGALPTARRCWS